MQAIATGSTRTDYHPPTLDLHELAGVGYGDRVVVVGEAFDRTDVLFQKTLRLLEIEDHGRSENSRELFSTQGNTFIPDNADLRKLFLFAEAVGGYGTLNDLDNVYSPGYAISRRCQQKALDASLEAHEVRLLEKYYDELTLALEHANRYLMEHFAHGFTAEEITGLHRLLISARDRAEQIRHVLAIHYTNQVEVAVKRLCEFHQKIKTVQKSINGIFLINSEVMFIPTSVLVQCVNDLFKAIGNPRVADSIDGLMLLAARNLLIEAVSFYSFYGKHQIYSLFQKNGGTVNRRAVTQHIRSEIRKLFDACARSNKLILRGVVNRALKEFELSVEAIQREAEHAAVRTVREILPRPKLPPAPPPRRGWFRRLLGKLLS